MLRADRPRQAVELEVLNASSITLGRREAPPPAIRGPRLSQCLASMLRRSALVNFTATKEPTLNVGSNESATRCALAFASSMLAEARKAAACKTQGMLNRGLACAARLAARTASSEVAGKEMRDGRADMGELN